ncbi:flagellar biosynthesis protein FlgF [Rubrivivax gelatinosus]|nr:flagellar biosynthesis protein FlgF [Rubrivivax gelatinosus]
MDALIYTLMSGAERALRSQQIHANNLANAGTDGFRADLEAASARKVDGSGYDARHVSELGDTVVASRDGTMRATGRDLDVALQGGYLTVRAGDGEAYTRAGALQLAADGTLQVNGRTVLGDAGPIVLPPYERVAVGVDGSVMVQTPGETEMQVVDRLKLVAPDADAVKKNRDGLIVARDGRPLTASDDVRVRSGHLEGSNVSAVEEMVATLSLNRDFEIQMKFYKSADDMVQAGNRLMRE